MAPEQRRPLERYLPLTYFATCIALVAVLLPTALRPPQDDPTTTSEFSPDAPPEENPDSILGDLSQGRSGTAGAGSEGEESGPVEQAEQATPPPEQRQARNCPYGFGDPPRQVESIYSAPCAPPWQGDNGGSTYKNVFPGEIRLGFYHSTDSCEGPTSSEPPDNESDGHRTMRILQDYVNQAYETYGRQVRLYCVPGPEKDNAVLAAEEWKVFASASTDFRYCREMVRRQLPTFCDPPSREEMLESRPYLWSWQMDRTSMQELGAEYYCKKLEGKAARFAGENSGFRSADRKLGILTQQTETTGLSNEPMIPALRERCGVEPAEHFVYTENVASDQVATAVTRLKVEGVTTVVLNIKFTNALSTLQAADGAAYYPEWLLFSPYGLDINVIGSLMPQSQMTQAFGLSGWEWPRPTQETECYRAYKRMDPNNEPNGATCASVWQHLVQFMNGIQAAGPHLTPETFRDGLFDIGYRFYDDIPWTIGGGYSATDYTYIDDVGEIWWDPGATKPEDGSPGAYRWVRCGERYRAEELPREDPLVFQDGATGPGRGGCG